MWAASAAGFLILSATSGLAGPVAPAAHMSAAHLSAAHMSAAPPEARAAAPATRIDAPAPPAQDAAPAGRKRKNADAPPPPRSDLFGHVLITEVMYNPASDEGRNEAEWVEIANVSGAPLELEGWRLDDEDHLPFDEWKPFTISLPKDGVAVIVNMAFVDEAQFRAAWDATDVDVPPPYLVVPVKWGGLSNSPAVGNEVLRLLDGEGALVCEVDLRNGDGWPRITAAGGPSVYLTHRGADLSDGALWKASTPGFDGARVCTPSPVFNGRDIGSPGTLPASLTAERSATPAPTPAAPPAGTPPAANPGSPKEPARDNDG